MIADAPWIRDAEMNGVPETEEIDFEPSIKSLEEADEEMDKVMDQLLAVEDDLDGTGYLKDIREVMSNLRDVQCTIIQMKNLLKKYSA